MGVLSSKPTTKTEFYTDLGLIAAATQKGSVDQQDISWMHEALYDLMDWPSDFSNSSILYKNSAGSMSNLVISANQVLARLSTGELTTLTIAEQAILGRITGGEIDALTSAEVQGIIGILQTAKVSMANGEVLALNTTPKTLVSAPASNILAIPRGIILRHNYLTAPFDTNTTLQLKIGSVIVDLTTTILTASATQVDEEVSIPLFANVAAATAVELTVKTGNPATGGGSLDAWLMYSLIDIT